MGADRIAKWFYPTPPRSMIRPLAGALFFLVLFGVWIAQGRNIWPDGLVFPGFGALFVWAAWIRMRHADRSVEG